MADKKEVLENELQPLIDKILYLSNNAGISAVFVFDTSEEINIRLCAGDSEFEPEYLCLLTSMQLADSAFQDMAPDGADKKSFAKDLVCKIYGSIFKKVVLGMTDE